MLLYSAGRRGTINLAIDDCFPRGTVSLPSLSYPNQSYREVLTRVVKYFRTYNGVYAIVLTGSLARGKAVEGSCIDLHVFLENEQFKDLVSERSLGSRIEAYSQLGGRICFYEGEVEGGLLFGGIRVDVGFTNAEFDPHSKNSFDVVRDEFETTIGNLLAYSVVLYEKDGRHQRLKQKYLPFYNDRLRKARLNATKEEFDYKIWKTKWLADRGEYLASLGALLEAQRILLQHVFIKERKYPIDYTKWINEQCLKILRMPDLYQDIVSTISGLELTKRGMHEKANNLEQLFLKYS